MHKYTKIETLYTRDTQGTKQLVEGTFRSPAVEFVKTNPDSTIGTAKMEGIVCKPAYELLDRNGDRIIVKIKWCDFKDLVAA